MALERLFPKKHTAMDSQSGGGGWGGGKGVAGGGVKGFDSDEAELRRQTPTSGPLLSPSWADEFSQGCVCLPL